MILSSSSSALSSFSQQWYAAAGSKTRPVSSSNNFCRHHHRIHFISSSSSSSYSTRGVCDPGSSSYPNKSPPPLINNYNMPMMMSRGVHTMSGRIPSPWLMLPWAVDDNDYKFYSLSQQELVSFNKTNVSAEETDDVGSSHGSKANYFNSHRYKHDTTEMVGSSHGWLAFFKKNGDEIMFLSDPVSGRNIKLPPIDTLVISKWNMMSKGDVTNVVISGSPDQEEEECRAMMIYSYYNMLAFCCPGRSLEWTPIGTNVYGYRSNDDREMIARRYESVVYSSRQKLFFCVTESLEFEAWDLSDPRSPRRVSMDDVRVDDDGKSPLPNYRKEYLQRQFLVMAEHSDELFLVRQFARPRNGITVFMRDYHHRPTWKYSENGFFMPYKTVRFGVHRYDPVARAFNYIHTGTGSSLDGLAMFVGLNHGFALRAVEYPELKPNSIYFTDREYEGWGTNKDDFQEEDDERDFGGHVGIFNYQDGTFSPCYYPSDYPSIHKTPPAHAWFTPNPLL